MIIIYVEMFSQKLKTFVHDRFLSLDLPPIPLFKDTEGGNIIPQVPLSSLGCRGTFLSIWEQTHPNARARAHTHTHTHTQTHRERERERERNVYRCTHTNKAYSHTCKCICIHMYIYTYTHTCTCTYIDIHIHAHTHTLGFHVSMRRYQVPLFNVLSKFNGEQFTDVRTSTA